jgi:hypothetical protein
MVTAKPLLEEQEAGRSGGITVDRVLAQHLHLDSARCFQQC